jgi:hypothetical protein
MLRQARRSLALLAIIPTALLLISCQQEQEGQNSSDTDASHTRAAVDALDKNTADARKARISNLEYDAMIDIAASEAGLGTARALLDGEAEIDGIEISPEVRWRLLIILSRHNADGIAGLLAAEIEQDASDFAQRRLLSAQAAAPSLANKEKWVAELQNPQLLTSLAKQRAVINELFPPTQTDLQLKVLEKLLSSLPQMSREADAYFLMSYTEVLFTPMCRQESNALLQTALEEFSGQLNPTALRFIREAHQLDVECGSLREAQAL